eukprot:764860-Hanusia_phi.AAC.2
MRVWLRRPDGEALAVEVGEEEEVDQLRSLLLWCSQNGQWDMQAVPREVRRSRREEGRREEMWVLGGEAEADSTLSCYEAARREEEEDLVQKYGARCNVHEGEDSRCVWSVPGHACVLTGIK